MTKHAARTGRYFGTHESKPARIAREPGSRFRSSRFSRWVYALLGGAGAVGVGQIARTSTNNNAPPAPTIHFVATMPSSTRPGEMNVAELKQQMAAASAALDQDKLNKLLSATGDEQNQSLSEAIAELNQSLSATTDVAAIDSARANITKEVQASPSLADLSVDAVGAFAAGLLVDILKEVRRRLIGKAVDGVLPEQDLDDPRSGTGEAKSETAQVHKPPVNAEIQQLADQVVEDSFRRQVAEQSPPDLGSMLHRAVLEVTADIVAEHQALLLALDEAERDVAADLQRRPQVFGSALTMTQDEAARIAATARHEAALLIATPTRLS